MINYYLQKTVEIDDEIYNINKNGDYRIVLDLICIMNDKDLSDDEKIFCALNIFYDWKVPKDTKTAWNEMYKFINCGEKAKICQTSEPKLMSWEKDFDLIASAVNKVLGFDIRGVDYLHWWTLCSAYQEIDGKSFFAQVVGIRNKKNKGKMDKSDKDFYSRNKDIVDRINAVEFSSEEEAMFKSILGEEM